VNMSNARDVVFFYRLSTFNEARPGTELFLSSLFFLSSDDGVPFQEAVATSKLIIQLT